MVAKKTTTKKKTSATKAVKKTVAKKTSAKKASGAKAGVKKTVAKKKTAARKPAAKKAAGGKSTAKKPAAKKVGTKKATAKKSAAKKTAKKTAAKKPTVRKTAAKKTAAKPTGAPRAKPASKEPPRDAKAEGYSNGPGRTPEESPLMEVEAMKVELELREHPPQAGPPPAPRELDGLYGETVVRLLVRDPEWLYVYWEIDDATRERFGIPRGGHDRRLLLRWYDVTDLAEFTGENAHRVLDVEVHDATDSWYQRMPEPNRCWCAELGVLDEQNAFLPICRTNVAKLPRDSMAEPAQREVWMRVGRTPREREVFETRDGRAPGGASAGQGAATEPGAPSGLHESRAGRGVAPGAQALSEHLAETLSSAAFVSSLEARQSGSEERSQDREDES